MSRGSAGSAEEEIAQGDRFAFGDNWSLFLETVDEIRIQRAEATLRNMLDVENLEGVRFIDVGSGSGLFSLAARRLGAKVHSFDYDSRSVACTAELKRRYFAEDASWVVEQGSVLDKDYLSSLGRWDLVYSWGVLHHTGAMWEALENVARLVAPNGRLYVAIYNDQGSTSNRWARIKRTYNESSWARPLLLTYGFVRSWGLTMVRDALHLSPMASWRRYYLERGMSPWRDIVDWVGGWPFEVATPEAIFRFYCDRGFSLENLVTRQGIGCNEFVLRADRRDRIE